MKKFPWVSAVFAAAFLMIQSAASADLISGKIEGETQGGDSLKITSENPVTQTQETLAVSVDDSTAYTGVNKEDLKEGDKVVVEAVQDESGALKAEAVNAVQM